MTHQRSFGIPHLERSADGIIDGNDRVGEAVMECGRQRCLPCKGGTIHEEVLGFAFIPHGVIRVDRVLRGINQTILFLCGG